METNNNMSESWWNMLGVLYRWRRFIVIVTGVMAVLSLIISLLLPLWYKASSRLLLPESGGGGLASALLGDMGSAAQSLLGISGGDYVRYMAILGSRTVKRQIVEEFDLIRVYELEDEEFPMAEAMEELSGNVEFVIDDEFDFLSIEVWDTDPQRAADMSNRFLELLDETSNRLKRQNARLFRSYVEERYETAEQDRTALLDSLRSFQEQYGVFSLEAQTEAYFMQLAELRGEALKYELQYEALKRQFGENNAQVRQFEQYVNAADETYQRSLEGQEAVMPVSLKDAPTMVRAYADIQMQRLIIEKILEMVTPLLEQARFDEERQTETLQIVDRAVPPAEKDKPKRAIICIVMTLSAFILAVLYAITMDWWTRNHAQFAQRLREASSRNAN